MSRAVGLLVLGVLACQDSSGPTAPTTPVPLSETLETEDIVFHFAAGDSVNAVWQQEFHEWATALLGVAPPGKIHYYKYLSLQHVRQLTGSHNRSWADLSTWSIHTPDPQHGHEALHLYTSLIGLPTDYFLEGIAVGLYLDPRTGDGPFFENLDDDNAHDLASGFLASGDLLPIESIVTSETFWSRPDFVTYPQAGSFVNFLFREFGIDKLKTLTAVIDHSASRPAVLDAFRGVYGISLPTAEERWHDFLRGWMG